MWWSRSIETYAYDVDGKVTSVTVDGVSAAVIYKTNQQIDSIAYSNGTSLSSATLDPNTRAQTGLGWSFASSSTLTDSGLLKVLVILFLRPRMRPL